MIFVWILCSLVLLFLLVIIVNTIRFRPQEKEERTVEPVSVDAERAISTLQKMIQIPTVSYQDASLIDPKPFEEFRSLLQESFPLVYSNCTFERVGTGGLLFRWHGKNTENITVCMAHYDVVPTDTGAWEHPPFSGFRSEGYLWGRGTLDTKGTLCAALSACESLLESGFKPNSDVYFAFSGGEEVSGKDAPDIVELLASRKIRPALVLDEGGAVVTGAFPGVSVPSALIGIAEKGLLNIDLSVTGTGGHASAPPVSTGVGILSRAVTQIETHPFPTHLSLPTRAMFQTLGPHSTFLYRMIFSNLWCFGGLLRMICSKNGGELNAMMRTTVAFTKMKGSEAYNILPPEAVVSANIRILRPDTVESTIERLKKTAGNPNIQFTNVSSSEASTFSRIDTQGYQHTKQAIEDVWPEAIVSPYLMMAFSDSNHYHRICDTVLRFSAMELSTNDRKTIHGVNERIGEGQFTQAVEFYTRLLKLR